MVISIEPADDDSPAPFVFKPLAAEVPAGIGDHQDILLGAGPAFQPAPPPSADPEDSPKQPPKSPAPGTS